MSNSPTGRPWPDGVGRADLDETDSTNTEALRRAAAGERGPLWITARRQTAARGRRGRAWATPPGNLAASLLLTLDADPAGMAQHSFAAALGLGDALDAITGRPELFRLKWPNDVLLSGAKLAGILLEAQGPALVIGFGVNLAVVPPSSALETGAVRPVSLATATGVSVSPDVFLSELAPAVADWVARLRTDGFAPVRAAWLARARGLGQPVVARLPGRVVAGTFETIDATGAIVLATPAGPVVLPAADVHFSDEDRGADASRG